jgi:hypothetical protein
MDSTSNKRIVGAGLLAFAAATAAVLLFVDPIPQPSAYYAFADNRSWLGIPNAWNVLSNLPFLLVGLIGLVAMVKNRESWLGRRVVDNAEHSIFVVLFFCTALLCFGSGYFHLLPDADRLAWDRYTVLLTMLPLSCAIVADRLDTRTAFMLVGPLILLGIASVIVWQLTDDLRFYAFMQFFPMVAMLVLLIALPSRYSHPRYLFLIMAVFVLSKAAEHFDRGIYAAFNGMVGGHALKHLFAALAMWYAFRWLSRRELLDQPDS